MCKLFAYPRFLHDLAEDITLAERNDRALMEFFSIYSENGFNLYEKKLERIIKDQTVSHLGARTVSVV